MSQVSQRVRDGLSTFGTITSWLGTVVVPLLLFIFGQRIESKIEAQKHYQEALQKQDESVARSTSLLANVAPLLFSNDVAPVTFALQILTPGDSQIPAQIRPLLLAVVTLYQQRNPELSDWALSILASKLSPSEIEDAREQIPQDFVIVVGGKATLGTATPTRANAESARSGSQAATSADGIPVAQISDMDVKDVTKSILTGKYNVIVGSSKDENGAVALTTNIKTQLRANGSDLQPCWKMPIPPSKYYGVVVGNGVPLAEAQQLRGAA